LGLAAPLLGLQMVAGGTSCLSLVVNERMGTDVAWN